MVSTLVHTVSVLYLTRYGRLVASSRYRSLKYAAALESQGIRCRFLPLLDDDYLARRYGGGGTPGAFVPVSSAASGTCSSSAGMTSS